MSLQRHVLSPPGLVEGLMEALDAPAVVLSGSVRGVGALNAVFTMDTTPVVHQQS